MFTLGSCTKEGPAGPEGPAGQQGVKGDKGDKGDRGPQGIDGNANAVRYTFSGHDFSTSVRKELYISIPKDSSERSAWFAYLFRVGFIYPVPGWGMGGFSSYRCWYYITSSSQTEFAIERQTGPGEAYTEIRLIRIYANRLINGKRSSFLPDIDFKDYYAVCKYYGLSTE